MLPLYFPRSLEEERQSLPFLPADIGNAEGEPVVPERQIRIREKPGASEGKPNVCVKRACVKGSGGEEGKRNGTKPICLSTWQCGSPILVTGHWVSPLCPKIVTQNFRHSSNNWGLLWIILYLFSLTTN